MKKVMFLLLVLAGVLWLPACGSDPEGENKFYSREERAVTAFLEYGVTDAAVYESYHGVRSQPDHRLVVVEVSIWNTEEYTLPMSRYDFRLQWGEGEEAWAYPLAWYCKEQLPDQYDIPEGEQAKGKLVFQVPEETSDVALGFLEIFENESQGDAHFIYFTV